MRAFRITVIGSFALSVAVTALSLTVFHHDHMWHTAHVIITTLMFLLIAAYLRKSAQIASLAAARELHERFARDESVKSGDIVTIKPNTPIRIDGEIISGSTRVDESALSGARELVEKRVGDTVYRGSINHGGEIRVRIVENFRVSAAPSLRGSSSAFNVCTGALAKSGIVVRPDNLLDLAKAKTLSPQGNLHEREGYAATRDTLAKMGVTLADSGGYADIALCDFTKLNQDLRSGDILITHNKITHVLKAVYVARVYAGAVRYTKILAWATFVVFCVLCAFRQFTFAGMAVAVWDALGVLEVRRLDRACAKLSFVKVAKQR
ncbi:MAG: hypothetical protein LBN02_02215 [Oscillospiraceae bacterium]|jgi:cation transport ATPase|nr:hypothetical protein [Oscillospiraceae bacterium]